MRDEPCDQCSGGFGAAEIPVLVLREDVPADEIVPLLHSKGRRSAQAALYQMLKAVAQIPVEAASALSRPAA